MLALNDHRDEENQTISLLFRTGKYAGQQYTAEISVCSNPVCTCEAVDLSFETGQLTTDSTLLIYLDIVAQTLSEGTQDPQARPLADALIEHMTESDWCLLQDFYFDTKTRITESIALEEIDTIFPAVVDEDPGALVGVFEVLPYSRLSTIEVDGIKYVLDEQYCVNPRCNCRDVRITFLPEDSSQTTPHNPPAMFISYKTKKWSQTDAGDCDKGQFKNLAATVIKNGCCEIFEARSKKMRSLFKLHNKKRHEQTRRDNMITIQKIGRNEPCPCGSGRKYKRCCMESG